MIIIIFSINIMNIESFYNELIDELEVFRLETKVSDEIITDLFQAYSEGK